MGVHGLLPLLQELCPNVFASLRFRDLRGIRIAIDISVFFNKFVKHRGPKGWAADLVDLLVMFKRNGIIPYFVFDGTEFPPEKKEEQDRRRKGANSTKDKLRSGHKILAKLKEMKSGGEDYVPEKLIEKAKSAMGPVRSAKLTIDFSDIYALIPTLEGIMKTIETQSESIKPAYVSLAKTLIDSFGFTYYQALGEAEGLCASLVLYKMADAVLSEDTDLLAYGTPFWLFKYNPGGCRAVAMKDILKALDLTQIQFTDMCILLGCDYTLGRVFGFPQDGTKRKNPVKIGPTKVYEFIKDCGPKGLDRGKKWIPDIKPLRYKRCRELFTPYSTRDLPLLTVTTIDTKRLGKIFKEHNIPRNPDNFKDFWKSIQLVEVDPDVDELESDSE